MYTERIFPSVVVATQPLTRSVTHLSDLDEFDDLLENSRKSTPGFEVLADVNILQIKKRQKRDGDDWWTRSWRYDVVGEKRESLLLCEKSIESYCAWSSYTVNAFTDIYKDPVFIINLQQNQCCKVTTASGTLVGSTNQSETENKYFLRNEIDGTSLDAEKDPVSNTYDIWEAPQSEWLGRVSSTNELFTIGTRDSVTSSTKVLLLALTFSLIK